MTFCGQMIPIASTIMPYGTGLCERCEQEISKLSKREELVKL